MKPCPEAIELFKEIIKDYRWTETKERQMIKMHSMDRKAFRKVLSLYRKRKWKEAAEFASHMDTYPREFIPDKIREDIQSQA